MEGGVGGGDGVCWWSLMRGPDRPSETVSPDKGGEALEPEQILTHGFLIFCEKAQPDLYDK